eukprot:1022824-Heterocapsa_arctica.AAC.1
MVESLACAHKSQEDSLAKLAGELALAVSLPAYVVNPCSGVWHKDARKSATDHPASWRTFCAWRYSAN